MIRALVVTAFALLLACAPVAHAADKNAGEVVVYNWSEYIPQDAFSSSKTALQLA